jgi:antitoxin component YwqK of YwqJK toxin-antitoxin module
MYPKYVLFEFYKKNGNINEASNYAKQILTMPVKSQSGAVSEMQNKAKIYLGNN